MRNDVKLRAPIEVTGDDVEKALFVQSLDEPAAARVLDRLRGAAAERAAEELNHALDIDIFEVLAQGGPRSRGAQCSTTQCDDAGPPSSSTSTSTTSLRRPASCSTAASRRVRCRRWS